MILQEARRLAILKLNKKNGVIADKKLTQSHYKKWLGKLRADQVLIKKLPNHTDRNTLAAKKLNDYLAYLREWIATKSTDQNDILTQCVIWAVDGQRWDVLFELADAALNNKNIVDSFWMERTLASFIAKEAHEIAYKLKRDKKDISSIPLAEVLKRIETDPVWEVLVQDKDGNWKQDNVLIARYNKTCAIEALEKGELEQAAIYYAKAHHAYPQIGVKNKLGETLAKMNIKHLEDDGKTVRPLDSLLKDIG